MFFNQGKTIKTLIANFGTNTNYTLVSNGVANTSAQSVNYTTFGNKQLQFTITYADNSTLVTYAKINILSSHAL